MDLLSKLERKVLSWLKTTPHLPEGTRKWLGDNVWWVVAIGSVLLAITALLTLSDLLDTTSENSYVLPGFATWLLVTGTIAFFYMAIQVVIYAFAVKPLQLKQKKGWVLLFISWLVTAFYLAIHAVLMLDVGLFIVNILLSAIILAVSGYFLFEIHGQFAHSEKSNGIKGTKTSK